MMNHTQHPRGVRDRNRALILRAIHRRPGLSRTDIATKVGLTDAAVSRITREMIDARLIREGGEITAVGRPGRRHVGLEIDPGGAVVLAVCLTMFEKSLSVVNLAGEVMARRDLSDIVTMPPDAIPDALCDAVLREIPRQPPALGLGVVVAGALDHALGLTTSGSLPSLIGLSLRPVLERRLAMPVRFENLGNALNVAELEDVAVGTGRDTVFLVHVALGLGSSLVIDGQPHRHDGDERLIGHVEVPGAAGQCLCGATGCLNTLVSGLGILARIDAATGTAGTMQAATGDTARHLSEAVDRANRGCPASAAIFEDAGRTLGRTLFAVMLASSPGRIILAGPVPQAASYVRGVQAGLAGAYSRTGVTPPALSVSRFSYAAATAAFAHGEFTFNVPIEPRRLATIALGAA